MVAEQKKIMTKS